MMREWTENEINYLKENWEEESDAEIAKQFGRTKAAVTQKRNQYHLVNSSYHWSEEEVELLKQNLNETAKAISRLINRSPKAIKAKKRRYKDLLSRQTNRCVDCGEEDPEFYVGSDGNRWNLCVDCVKDIIPEFFNDYNCVTGQSITLQGG